MKNAFKTGFTVVEILIVIAVIGILASLTVVAYKGVTARAVNTEISKDTSSLADMLEAAFLRDGKFPTNLSALGNLNIDPKTTTSYTVGSDGQRYCLTATQTGYKSYVITDDGKLSEGDCSSWVDTSPVQQVPPDQPSATIASTTTNSLTLTWNIVSGASSYSVKYGTSTPSNGFSCTTSPCTITGLTANTTYYANVTAENAAGTTASNTVNGLTRIPAPAAANVTYVKSTVKYGAFDTRRRYDVTASGGACSIGTTEWQINATGVAPQFSTWPWQTGTTGTFEFPENGQYSPDDITVYATPRCKSGSNITEGTTATAISGTGGAYL